MKHSVLINIGESVLKYAELTDDEIQEVWADIQARCLPTVKLGWYDTKNKWNQLTKRGHKF